MWCFIAAEAAVFTIFVVAYLFYAGRSLSGPTPADVLHLPIVATICLLSSSVTMHVTVQWWKRGAMSAFAGWWLATIVLGAIFVTGTAIEWRGLIYDKGLTIQSNLFGTTYYALIGLHAVHVTVGLACLSLVSALAFLGHVKPAHAERGDVLSLYWHFVDGVWVVVFMVVYVIAR